MMIALGYLVLLAVLVGVRLLGRRREAQGRGVTPLVLSGHTAAVPALLTPAAPVSRGWDRAAGYALTLASVSALAVTAMSVEPSSFNDDRAVARHTQTHDLGPRAQLPLAWLALEAGFNFDQLGVSPSQAMPDPLYMSAMTDGAANPPAFVLPESDHEAMPGIWLSARSEDLWV